MCRKVRKISFASSFKGNTWGYVFRDCVFICGLRHIWNRLMSQLQMLKKNVKERTHTPSQDSHTDRYQSWVEDVLGSVTTDPQDAQLVVRIGRTKAVWLVEQGAEEMCLLKAGPCPTRTVALHIWMPSSTRQNKHGPTPN